MAFGDFAIAPSTTVTLCAGVPLSKGSVDTLYFTSSSAQASSIGGYAIPGATFTECTYQRNQRNTIRLGMPMGTSGANSALRANYCIFNNTAFEGKPIYAFVDTVDYVNNNTIDVHFTIDAMQTFMFDYTLGQCFVEREHSVTDQVGDNVVSENFTSLSMVVHSEDERFLWDNPSGFLNTKYKTVIYHSKLDPQQAYTGEVVNNVYVGCEIQKEPTTATTINGAIQSILANGGEIRMMAAVPQSIADAGASGYVHSDSITINTDIRQDTTIYTPKNKKLFTYPFNYLTVSNNAGDEKQYRWEWFKQNAAHFGIYGGYVPAPECALVPYNYRGSQVAYGEMCFFNNFPQSCWNEDSFLTWYQRNSNSYAASCTNNTISGFSNLVSSALAGAAVGGMQGSALGAYGTAIGAIVGGVGSALNMQGKERSLEASVNDTIAAPDKVNGNSAASVVNEVIGCTGFTLYRMNVCVDQAKSIDDYFTMYGYATNKVKTPNRNVRPHWTYTKTQGCTVYGNIPAEYATEIQERYNNGVRFWKTASEVGNYSLDNSV